MNWLARLKKIENAPAPPLQNLQKKDYMAFVGFVGITPASFQNSEGEVVDMAEGLPCPANDVAAPADTDIITARLALFTHRGLNLYEAEAIVHWLADRDGQLDERKLCLECQHLSGTIEARRCSQWRKIRIGSAAIPVDLVTLLQRCSGFTHTLKTETLSALMTAGTS